MKPELLSVDNQKPTSSDSAFRYAELRRLFALIWPFRRSVLLGLLATLIYISLHTFSLAAAFPVFKVLLEKEGLDGWIDRTVVGARFGIDVAPIAQADTTEIVITHVRGGSVAEVAGLKPLDVWQAPDSMSIADCLHDTALTDQAITTFSIRPSQTSDIRAVPLSSGVLDWQTEVLLRGRGLLPDQAAQSPLDLLKYILVALIVIVVLANVFRYFGEVCIASAVLRAMMSLRATLYAHTLHLPVNYFSQQSTSDTVTRFIQDIQEVQRGMLTLFGKFIREPLRAMFILALAFVFDWRITLTMVVVAPMTVLIFWSVGRSVKKANRKLLQAYGKMIGALTTCFQNLRVVKAYTAEDYEHERLRTVDRYMFRQQLKLAKLQAFTSPMIETLAVIAASFATVWLASRVVSQDLDTSRFAALGIILASLFDPLRKLTDVYVRVQRSTAGVERIFHILHQPRESHFGDTGVPVKPLTRAIEFAEVSYTYPGAEQPALRNINLTVAQGETLALVGPNGCGKTTLVSLIPRFFDPDIGKILYDGLDLRDASLKTLRKQVSLVTQEAIVFEGTPLENISYGITGSSIERVEEAAQRAHADEFIRRIPGAYKASLGERGTTLSGGQRQRLAIARAIFSNAPLLIFDEATSQIDAESELDIQTALQEYAQGRTTIIIAHRLSTIQFATRIVVMDDGRIIDSGTHKALFDRCSLYRILCETQLVSSSTD